MQIIHRISTSSSQRVRSELATFGVVVPATGFVTFEVDEASDSWPALKRWIAEQQAVDFVVTKFSRGELASARWLELVPDWHQGYPQPDEDNFGYRAATYDLTEYCVECGTGLRQRAPFQMRSEPKWGRNSILQLNWIFDEFFVKPDLYTSAFKPRGIRSRPVVDTKGAELKTVVQLVIDDEVSIVTDGLAPQACSRCGRVKYEPVMRGRFPALRTEPKAAAAKTAEYFGSGASAHKRVIVSRDLAQQLDNVRGASTRPVAGT